MAGGLFGDTRHVPERARPNERIPRLQIHVRLRGLLRVGRARRPRDVRRDKGAGRRGTLVYRRRLVHTARLQYSVGRELRAPRADFTALLQEPLRKNRKDRLQRRFVRTQRVAAADTAAIRHGELRVHAPRPARKGAFGQLIRVGERGRLKGSHIPAAALLQYRHALARTPRRDSQIYRYAPDDGVLRRRQSRRRTDYRAYNQNQGARTRQRGVLDSRRILRRCLRP